MGAIAIAEGVYRETPEPTLIGGRHLGSGRIVFPCPNDKALWEAVDLPRHGTLWSWTVQRFRPKSPPYAGPEDFQPFAIGYVELPGAVIVEARLAHVAFNALKIGMPMQLTVVPFSVDANGNEVRIYAFAPAGGE